MARTAVAKNKILCYNGNNMWQEPVNFLQQQTEKVKLPTPRWKIFFIVLVLIFVGGYITRAIIGEYAPNDPAAYDPVTLKAREPEGFFQKVKYLVFAKEKTLQGESDDRINVLLLGMGGPGHDGPFLTDTNIIISIRPSTGAISMISIPRDLGVKIANQGIKKINYANSFGESEKNGQGGEFTRQLFEDTFDMDIPYYVRVDFQAFADMVDAVGGVTINVENTFVDHMFPAPNNDFQTVSFEKGVQTMTGDTALKFVRSRHGSNGEGSDFARARRQQLVLSALKSKVLSFNTLANPIRLNNIYQSLEKHLTTNLQFSDIVTFIKMLRNLKTDAISNLVLDDAENGFLKVAYGQDGAFLLVPKSDDFDEINEAIKNIFDKQSNAGEKKIIPEQTAPPASSSAVSIEIQNGTWSAGLAARMKKRLEDRNFMVETIGNTAERPQAQSGIYNLSGRNLENLEKSLEEELHIPIRNDLPNDIVTASSTDIIVILGEDNAE